MCVCIRLCERTRARVGLVVSLVFCDDDVFSVFRGMPRAALIVTELGPRATLVRMRAVALAFSASPPLSLNPLPPPPRPSTPILSPLSSPLSVLSCAQVVCRVEPCVGARGSLARAGGYGYPAAITPRLHAHARMHARTHERNCV